MQGNAGVIEVLNEGLCAELTAINQFFIHGKMCENWGYTKLAAKYRQESIEEMKHADEIIVRILFLDGVPNMQKYNKICVGSIVQEQFENDLALEIEAVEVYNRGIALARDVGDNGSRELFERLLVDEEEHVDWLETQLHAMKQVGTENYLAQQLGGDAG